MEAPEDFPTRWPELSKVHGEAVDQEGVAALFEESFQDIHPEQTRMIPPVALHARDGLDLSLEGEDGSRRAEYPGDRPLPGRIRELDEGQDPGRCLADTLQDEEISPTPSDVSHPSARTVTVTRSDSLLSTRLWTWDGARWTHRERAARSPMTMME